MVRENSIIQAGDILTIDFELARQSYSAINGDPIFEFSPAISFVVLCKDQAELDYYWEKLSEGGETQQCAWLKDRFGVSWQVIPRLLQSIEGSGDREKVSRAMTAMLKMKKLDIQALQDAFDGVSPQ